MDVSLSRLSPREREVAESIYSLVPRKIAVKDMAISISTFNAYLHNCYLKLNVRTPVELALFMEREKVKEAA